MVTLKQYIETSIYHTKTLKKTKKHTFNIMNLGIPCTQLYLRSTGVDSQSSTRKVEYHVPMWWLMIPSRWDVGLGLSCYYMNSMAVDHSG